MNLIKIIERLQKEFQPMELSINLLYNPHKIYGHMVILEGKITYEINPCDDPDEVLSKLHKKIGVIGKLTGYVFDNDLDLSILQEHPDGFSRGEVFLGYDGYIYQLRDGQKIKIKELEGDE